MKYRLTMQSQLFLILIMMFVVRCDMIACTIIPKSFCSSIQVHSDDLIVLGEILSKDMYGLDLKIIEVIRGQETRSVVRVWNGTDFECNGVWTMEAETIGEVNDTVLITLPKIENLENSWDVIDDYRRPDPYYHTSELKMENGKLNGLIKGDAIAPPEFKILSIDYQELKNTIINNNDCSDLVTNVNEVELSSGLKFMNPFSSNLEIEIPDIIKGRVINIYTIRGQRVKSEQVINRNKIEIDFNSEIPGIYILEFIMSDNQIKYYKLIKN